MVDSMTQSMASVSSLARDFSWEQLHTDTEKEVRMVMMKIAMVMMMMMMNTLMMMMMMMMMASSLARDFSQGTFAR